MSMNCNNVLLEQDSEINLLATFDRLIRSIPTVIIVVTDKSLGDTSFVVAAKGAVITCVVGC